jgi:hypothetical protein
MMRTVRSIIILGSALAIVLGTPTRARARAGAAPAGEVVAEAAFLEDALPPGSQDLNVSVQVAQGEPDPATGRASVVATPRLQLTTPLADGRLGLTVDVGVAPNGAPIDAPGASLKVLLRAPEPGRTGYAASLDLFGSLHRLSANEAGVGLNALRTAGPVTLRGAAGVATGVSAWSPHLHGGLSGGLALGERWRFLGELLVEVSRGEAVVSAGPTLKVALRRGVSLAAGALFHVAPSAGAPTFLLQLSRPL